ncbi:MAG: hypothetical protein PVF90_01775 [Gemmatimonadota bacterium]
MRSPGVRLLLLGMLVGSVACFDSGAPPRPGTLTALVQSPNGDEGAAVLLLLGDDAREVRSAGGTEAYSAASAEGTRVVLIHPAGGALTFEVEMADTERPPSVLFRQVAGPDDALRDDVSGYVLRWSR